MAKIMVSLLQETHDKLRDEVERLYHGKVGGLSIFFETLIRDYFARPQPQPLQLDPELEYTDSNLKKRMRKK